MSDRKQRIAQKARALGGRSAHAELREILEAGCPDVAITALEIETSDRILSDAGEAFVRHRENDVLSSLWVRNAQELVRVVDVLFERKAVGLCVLGTSRSSGAGLLLLPTACALHLIPELLVWDGDEVLIADRSLCWCIAIDAYPSEGSGDFRLEFWEEQ